MWVLPFFGQPCTPSPFTPTTPRSSTHLGLALVNPSAAVACFVGCLPVCFHGLVSSMMTPILLQLLALSHPTTPNTCTGTTPAQELACVRVRRALIVVVALVAPHRSVHPETPTFKSHHGVIQQQTRSRLTSTRQQQQTTSHGQRLLPDPGRGPLGRRKRD